MSIVRSITPGFIRRSFALKFGLVLIVLGLAVGAVGVFGSEQLKGEFQEEVDQKFSTLAKQQAEALRDWNDNNIQTLDTFSRLPVMRNGNTSEVRSYLLYERRQRETWGGPGSPNLHYVDKQSGEILTSTNNGGRYVGSTAEDLAPVVAQAVNEIQSGQETRRTAAFDGTSVEPDVVKIAYVSTIPDQSNRVLVYTVPSQDYAQSLSSGGVFSESGSAGVAMVVDEQNRVIFEQYGNRSQYLRPYPNNGVYDAATDNETGGPDTSNASVAGPANGDVLASDSVYGLAGKEYVVGYSQVQGTEWVVTIHTNTESAYGEVQQVADLALLATLIGVLLIAGFGAVLGRNTATAIDRLTSKAEEMEEGNLEVDLTSPRTDNIGRLYQGFANMRNALKQQIEEAEKARKEAEVSRAEALEMNNYLQDRADEYAQIMQQCAAGDLTQRMDADGENEAMDRIAEEFNEMIDELEKTTGQLKSFADEVETAGDVVKNSSESVRDASEQVADSVQKISDDAYDQKERLQEISETMDQIANDLDTFATQHDLDFGESLERIEEVANMLSEVVDLSEETMAETENVAGAAEEQAAELNEVTQRAEDLSRYARPLREVLDRFETESEHEFYFPTGPGSGDSGVPDSDD